MLLVFVYSVVLGACPAAPEQRSLWTLSGSFGLLRLWALVSRIDVCCGNVDGFGHCKRLQSFSRVGFESTMGRCRPWLSAALRSFDLLPRAFCHLHALFDLKVGNCGKLPFSVVVVALIVHLVPVLAASALEGLDFADVLDLSAFW